MPQINKNSGIWLNGWSKLPIARRQITSEYDAEIARLEAELNSFKLKAVKNNNYYYKYIGGGKWKYFGSEKSDPARVFREQIEKIRAKRVKTLAKFEETLFRVGVHAVIDLSVFKPPESELLDVSSLVSIMRGEQEQEKDWSEEEFKE